MSNKLRLHVALKQVPKPVSTEPVWKLSGSAEIYRYIAILQYLVLQYTAIHLVPSIDILRVNYLLHYCDSYMCVSSGGGLCVRD